MGRPSKYIPEYAERAEKLCAEKGHTDAELAAEFKVSERTIYYWKSKFLQFFQAIKKGKDEYDTKVVEESLLKRAVGYSYEEKTSEPCIVIRKKGQKPEVSEEDLSNIQEEMVVTKVIIKEVVPDVTAQIFWLKNRQPERWRDVKDYNLGGSVKLILEEEE